MRYLISESFKDEVSARKEYISEAMNLWFTQHECSDGSIMLESIPPNELDIFFIVGHNKEINKYINNNIKNIHEKRIVAITCNANLKVSVVKKYEKDFYISLQRDSYCDLLDGSLYGFDFNPTESEIILYNNSYLESISKRITGAFQQKY